MGLAKKPLHTHTHTLTYLLTFGEGNRLDGFGLLQEKIEREKEREREREREREQAASIQVPRIEFPDVAETSRLECLMVTNLLTDNDKVGSGIQKREFAV